MQELVLNIINTNHNNLFVYNRLSENSVKHLKIQSNLVPNTAGLYLVFCRENIYKANSHLKFEINNINHTLLYFGKAGGTTHSGKIITQGLNGRINNVVSDSKRNLKDVKRANYWTIVMTEYQIETLYVIYYPYQAPQSLENIIYNFLDVNNLVYPLMNKKRGRYNIL